jgi:hypothetical protein
MVFDLTLLLAHQIFKLASHGLERVTHRHVHIGVGLVLIGLASGQQFVARGFDVHAHMKMVPLMVVLVQLFYRHAAAVDTRVKLSELVDLLSNARLQCFGFFKVPKSDLQGNEGLTGHEASWIDLGVIGRSLAQLLGLCGHPVKGP